MNELSKKEIENLGSIYNAYLGAETQIPFIMYHMTMGFIKATQEEEVKDYDLERFKNAIELLWQINRVRLDK